MSDLLSELQDHVLFITLNRINKHNAFDDIILTDLQHLLEEARDDNATHVIVIKAHGDHFSAGADLTWMQRIASLSEEDNLADAMILARLMFTLYHHPKPTIAMVHGGAFGGGAGLVAACDLAIAAESAHFCFSEVKLGLIPAVISPYVIRAIGERAALELFMTAETIDAHRACELKLVHHCVPEEDLLLYTTQYAEQIAQWAPGAIQAVKSLVRQVASLPIDPMLQSITANLIAKQRVSEDGQRGLHRFLHNKKP